MPQGGFLSEQETLPPAPEQAAVGLAETSSVEQDAQAMEQLAKSGETFLEQAEEQAPTSTIAATGSVVNPATTAPEPDPVFLDMEKILEEGLGVYVKELSPEAKERFTKKGQEVAGELAQMAHALQAHVKRVIRLIHDWLLTIPGVNKYFLEQEAKIKTDRVMEYVARRKESPPPPHDSSVAN